MKTTPEQLDFIRQHGITRCPPSPEIRPYWGMAQRNPGKAYFSSPTEADMLRAMTRFDLEAWRPPLICVRPMSKPRKNGARRAH